MTTTSAKTKAISLCTSDGRLVGVLRGNIFRKRVKESKHLFRSIGDHGAWGIDYTILHEKLPETCVIMIDDFETGKHYQIPSRDWRANGIIMHFKEGTKDHHVQVFLPRSHFLTFSQK